MVRLAAKQKKPVLAGTERCNRPDRDLRPPPLVPNLGTRGSVCGWQLKARDRLFATINRLDYLSIWFTESVVLVSCP